MLPFFEVGINDQIPLLFREFQDGHPVVDPCVVDQNVNPVNVPGRY